MTTSEFTEVVLTATKKINFCEFLLNEDDTPGNIREENNQLPYLWDTMEYLGTNIDRVTGYCRQRVEDGKGTTPEVEGLKQEIGTYQMLLNSGKCERFRFIKWRDVEPLLKLWADVLGTLGEMTKDPRLSWLSEQEDYKTAVREGRIINGTVWTETLPSLARWLGESDFLPYKGETGRRDWKAVDGLFIIDGEPVSSTELSKKFWK